MRGKLLLLLKAGNITAFDEMFNRFRLKYLCPLRRKRHRGPLAESCGQRTQRDHANLINRPPTSYLRLITRWLYIAGFNH
jgi:hypothetical protein